MYLTRVALQVWSTYFDRSPHFALNEILSLENARDDIVYIFFILLFKRAQGDRWRRAVLKTVKTARYLVCHRNPWDVFFIFVTFRYCNHILRDEFGFPSHLSDSLQGDIFLLAE